MELENQANSLNLALKEEIVFKRHWSFHLIPVLALLQITGHLVNVYHLILLKPLPIVILLFIA